MNMRLAHPIRTDLRTGFDATLGSLLAIAAIAVGVVGWILSVTGHTAVDFWFFSGAILGILAIGVVLDESRSLRHPNVQRTEVALSWLLMLGALGLGVVGFIGGLLGGHDHLTWLWSGIILSIVAVGVMADEGRRLRATAHGIFDELLGTVFSLLALGCGVVGFVLGITGNGDAFWLYAGVIAALGAAAFMFDGERRAGLAAADQPQEETRIETRETYRPPMTG
jgi:hypothetical protein